MLFQLIEVGVFEFAGDFVILAHPLAQIDEPASGGAERRGWCFHAGRRLAGRAGRLRGIGLFVGHLSLDRSESRREAVAQRLGAGELEKTFRVGVLVAVVVDLDACRT